MGTLPVVQGYDEFIAATVYNDAEGIRSSSGAFDQAILAAAQDLSSRFVLSPGTLNLAVLLAPTNDLFEEIARRDALVDTVRRSFHVMIAGPHHAANSSHGLAHGVQRHRRDDAQSTSMVLATLREAEIPSSTAGCELSDGPHAAAD